MYFDLWNYKGILDRPLKFYIPKDNKLNMNLYLLMKWKNENLIIIENNNIDNNIYINEIGEIGFDNNNCNLNIMNKEEDRNKLFINLLKRDYYFDKIIKKEELIKINKIKIIKKNEIILISDIMKYKFIINLNDNFNEIEFFSFGCIPIFIKKNKFSFINSLKINIHYLFFYNYNDLNKINIENEWNNMIDNVINFYKNYLLNKNSFKELIKIISLNY
jgi:autonomous glycyl radical cofactor GrcA